MTPDSPDASLLPNDAKLQKDVLPDSRLKTNTGAKPGPGGLYWIPVFCANCGTPNGYVPDNGWFTCWLCMPCSEIHGEAFAGMLMPDEVFWEKVRLEQMERYGRELTPEELAGVVAVGSSPLATLIREGS